MEMEGLWAEDFVGRLDRAVIWFWIMPGLISYPKSWPRRPGLGEILPLTSDLWHSGGPACGFQHEMLVTSVSLFGKLTPFDPSSTSLGFGIFLLISSCFCVVRKSYLKVVKGHCSLFFKLSCSVSIIRWHVAASYFFSLNLRENYRTLHLYSHFFLFC